MTKHTEAHKRRRDASYQRGYEEGRIASIPEGWQLVPIEPTWSMQIEGRDAIISASDDDQLDLSTNDAAVCYGAMLTAAPSSYPFQPKPVLSNGESDVLAERLRQINSEGWSYEHDDHYLHGELVRMSVCYAREAISENNIWANGLPIAWPDQLNGEWWKPADPRRNLVKAAALLIAEIDRLDRAAS